MNSDIQPQPRYIPPSRRRDKPILSCTLCRRRKLKCDRQQPCKTCVDRGLSLSCTYTRTHPTPTGPSAPKASNNVHDRIDQLEKLVTTLMETKGYDKNDIPTALSSLSPPGHIRPDPGELRGDAEAPGTPAHMKLDREETTYTDSGHWLSILDSIAELKDELEKIPSEPQPDNPADTTVGPDLLLGGQKQATRQEIIAGLPSKAEADILVDKYYKFVDMAPTLMHKPKFLREYEDFWKNPDEAPVMWLGSLYGIFAIATRIQSLMEEYDAGISDPSQRTFSVARTDFYRTKLVQCLILANYVKCPPYTIETFMSYFIVEYLRSRDTQHGIWLLVSILVRMAFRMGLHREPSKLGNITPFEAEMRRRNWSMVIRLDLMSSSQVGLPRLIHSSMSDTLEPRNLIDEDLYEDMTELPPSRPFKESTPMLYTIVRNRVLIVFARIVDLCSASDQPTYREVLELDTELRNTYEGIPDSHKGVNAKEFNLSSDISMRILILSLSFLKALLVLHRPFLFLGRSDVRYEYSRTACIDAAIEMLEFQQLLETQSRWNKELWDTQSLWWTSSWRLSSLIAHDFLLATTLLALDLHRDIAEPLPENDIPRERFKSGRPKRAEIIEMLTRSYDIWSRASAKSREAARVAAAVKYVLRKANVSGDVSQVPTPDSAIQQPNFEALAQQEAAANSFFFDLDNIQAPLNFPSNDIPMDIGEPFNWVREPTMS